MINNKGYIVAVVGIIVGIVLIFGSYYIYRAVLSRTVNQSLGNLTNESIKAEQSTSTQSQQSSLSTNQHSVVPPNNLPEDVAMKVINTYFLGSLYQGTNTSFSATDSRLPSGLDPKTFSLLPATYYPVGTNLLQVYGKDDYFAGSVSDTVTLLNGKEVKMVPYDWYYSIKFAKDKNHVYKNSQTYNGNVKIFANADPATFTISEYPFRYAWDKSHVWFNNHIFDEHIINNADPTNFIILQQSDQFPNFSKDKNHVYIFSVYISTSTQIIQTANPKTFHVLGNDFSADDEHLFNPLGNLIKGVDPSGFLVLGGGLIKTNNTILFNGEPVDEADAKTFTAAGPLFKDVHRLYQVMEGGMDPAFLKVFTSTNVDLPSLSFIGYSCHYSHFFKDKNYVYEKKDSSISFVPVPGANPTTFQSPTCGVQRGEP